MESSGERQVSDSIAGIRADHVARYRYACESLRPGMRVLDVACGVGYGAALLASAVPDVEVVAVDISVDAIAYGRRHYGHDRISWIAADVHRLPEVVFGHFDLVCSFETVEHLEQDRAFLRLVRGVLAPDGRLLVSTPNADVMPFDPLVFPFHVRHYTTEEFIRLLRESGYSILESGAQIVETVHPAFGGRFNIAVCGSEETDMAGVTVLPFEELVSREPLSCALVSAVGVQRLVEMLVSMRRDWETVRVELDRLAEQGCVQVYHALARTSEARGEVERARDYLKRVLASVAEPSGLLASALFHLGRLSADTGERRDYLERCLDIEPGHRAARTLLTTSNKPDGERRTVRVGEQSSEPDVGPIGVEPSFGGKE